MKKMFLLVFLLTLISFSSFIAVLFFSPNAVSGFAISTVQNATVNLSVGSVLAITLTNSTINFGSCAINTTRGFSLLDSSLNYSGVNNADCFNGSFPSSLVVKNIGNTPANISVRFSQSGYEFFNDSGSWLAYKTLNNSVDGGCADSDSQSTFVNVTNSSDYMLACSDLSFRPNSNKFALFVRAFINSSASGGGNLSILFVAHPID